MIFMTATPVWFVSRNVDYDQIREYLLHRWRKVALFYCGRDPIDIRYLGYRSCRLSVSPNVR